MKRTALAVRTALLVTLFVTPAVVPACFAGDDPAGLGKGALVIVGGALTSDNAPVYLKILELALPDKPVCIIPLASGDPRSAAIAVLSDLVRHGGEGVAQAIEFTAKTPERAHDSETVKLLRACGGFYFTGGDQSRIVDVLRPNGGSTPAFEAIRDVLRAGGVVAGSSAGAAMMTDPMIGSGDAQAALDHGLVDHDDENAGVWIRNGMGFFGGALTDQHFLARGRTGRLLALLDARADIKLAFGIDENTALVVRGDHAAVLGPSGVIVFDAQGATRRGAGKGFTGAKLFLLGEGDRWLLNRDEAVPSADKEAVAAREDADPPGVPLSPFVDAAFAYFLGGFAPYPAPGAILPAGRWGVRLAKPDGFRALARPGRGAYGMPRDMFAGPFTVDLVPIDEALPRDPAPSSSPVPAPKRDAKPDTKPAAPPRTP